MSAGQRIELLYQEKRKQKEDQEKVKDRIMLKPKKTWKEKETSLETLVFVSTVIK